MARLANSGIARVLVKSATGCVTSRNAAKMVPGRFDNESMVEFLAFCAKPDKGDAFGKQQLDQVANVFA